MTTTAAPAHMTLTPAERAFIGRQLLDGPDVMENLRGDGDDELLAYAASDDARVVEALDAIGELPAEDLPSLGRLLAEQLVEDAIEAEAAKQLGAYRAAKAAVTVIDPAAYEVTDPKHPDFLNRIGV